MSDIFKLSKLSFFQIGKYTHKDYHVCDYRSMPRPHYCMALIIKGCADFEFKNETVHIKKGDIIFVPVASTYISKWYGTPDILYISVHFSFELPTVFPREKKINIQKISLSDYNEIYHIFTKMYSGYTEDKSVQFSVLGMFYSLMSKIYPELSFVAHKEIDERIKCSIEYIEEHYTEDFPMEILSKLSCMSVSHFHTEFKKYTGMSPVEYKHTICIRRAELMLLEKKKRTVEEISEALGFSSSIYFRKVFKKITGKTPVEYRKVEFE